MAQISIHLDRGNPVYRPGEIISGKAIITLDKPLSVRQVNIAFFGEAQVMWSDGDDDRAEDETIFCQPTTVWPDKRPIHDSSSTMPAGKYEFKFSFLIPEKSPTGLPLPDNFALNDGAWFRPPRGYIRYMLEIRVVRPTLHFDQTLQTSISIRGVYDLNVNPWAPFPAVAKNEKTICSWCCASGRIEASIKLPKTGYAIGEHLGVWTEVVNRSPRTIKQIRLELIQVCTFRLSNGWTKEAQESVIVAAIKNEPVPPGRTQCWENQGFQIPSFTRTSGQVCRTIAFSHDIHLELAINGCSTNLKVWIPVIIGNVPVKATVPSPTVK